jgi:hypothetical protein
VHRAVGFGEDDGEDEKFVREAREISDVLSGLGEISFGVEIRLCVGVDLERLFLVRELDFEEVVVDYVCRHRGVVDVCVVDIGVVDVGVGGVGVMDVDVVDVRCSMWMLVFYLDDVSKSKLSLDF